MKEYINKAKILVDALPFIKKLRNKNFVIKYGGATMNSEEANKALMEDIVLLKYVGTNPVIVHGGGPEISGMLNRLGIESKFINGLRVTNEETMDVVEMMLAGKINKRIVTELQKGGVTSVGISGKDGNSLIAEKFVFPGCKEGDEDLGCVGKITKVNPELIMGLIENNVIPVIAPIATDEEGNTYNINADYAAVAIAGAIGAKKLVFMTNVPGILEDKDDPTSILHFVNKKEVKELKDNGIISGGMIPKVDCCLSALDEGVKMVHIIDGTIPHSVLLEIFIKEGIGTMFTKE